MLMPDRNAPTRCSRCGNNSFARDVNVFGPPVYICGNCGQAFQRDRLLEMLGALHRLGFRLQLRWWAYLFLNPDLLFGILFGMVSAELFLATGKNASFLDNAFEWLAVSLVVSIGPILLLLFFQRKRARLGVIAGWRVIPRNSLKPVLIVIALMSALFMARMITMPAERSFTSGPRTSTVSGNVAAGATPIRETSPAHSNSAAKKQ